MSGISKIQIPADLVKVNALFEKNGHKAYLVGGAVRDIFLNKEGHDWDLATSATPQEVMKIFHRVIPTGIAHGTVTIHIFGHEIETTTFRADLGYSDGRHPDKVVYAKTIEEDLSRRDFTMNAIAADLATGIITDPYNGLQDIKDNIIRTVGNPLERFNEDGLRPVRAVRFAGQLGFTIENNTLKAISEPAVLKKTAGISVERFRDEFCKMLAVKKPSVCLKLLEQSGIMHIFIPEFDNCRNCLQADSRGFHEFDVADHIIYAVDGSRQVDFSHDELAVSLAAFYHDIGKPESKTIEEIELDGTTTVQYHFLGHESISEKKARASMNKLKFPNAVTDKVCHLVKEHMFYYESNWSDAAVRRFIIRVGLDNVKNLMALRLSDTYGQHNIPIAEDSPVCRNLIELQKRIEKAEADKAAFSIKDLKVNGKDLIQAGIPAGKIMGQILKELFETVTESPLMNEHDKLLALAKNIYSSKY